MSYYINSETSFRKYTTVTLLKSFKYNIISIIVKLLTHFFSDILISMHATALLNLNYST